MSVQNLLCVNLSYNSSVALFRQGKLVCALEEERLSREKLTTRFPALAIAQVLKQGGLTAGELDLVLLSSRITPPLPRFALEKFYFSKRDDRFSPLLDLIIWEQNLMRKTGLIRLESALILPYVRKKLAQLGIVAPLERTDHHLSHSYSAYSAASFDDTLVVSLDAMGDGLGCLVSLGRDGKLVTHSEHNGFHTPAYIYSQVTQLLGFTPERHEGKITGLAAFGDPQSCADSFRQLMGYDGRQINIKKPWSADHPLYKKILSHKREDVAASLQQVFEEVTVSFLKDRLKETGKRNLALAGGIFANVKLNQRIAETEEVQNLFVYPNMGDGGLPVGAGYSYFKTPPQGIEHCYYGPEYSETEIAQSLEGSGLQYRRSENVEEEAATLLANSKVVARFNGAMEYGPRALGNRSILYHPGDKTVNDWLNKRLLRTEFMPFAPSTLIEDAEEFYEVIPGTKRAAQFMTITYNCTALSRERQPAVVHVDNTARPQLVDKSVNPSYHALISAFKAKTGIGSMVNTSFNMHEEPIVCSPGDAIRAFKDSGLDALALGNFIVTAPQG